MTTVLDISLPQQGAQEQEALQEAGQEQDRRGHKGPQRRCIASGENKDKSALLRFVLGPGDKVVPDLAEKLPGRGVWITAERSALEQAVQKGLFSRGFKRKVDIDDNLIAMTEALLKTRLLSLLKMAMKSGHILIGFDQVKRAAQADYLAWRIEAADGSEDGRGKIRVLTKAVSRELERPITPVLGILSSAELGQALGRDYIVHAALKPGSLAKAFSKAATRYEGFAGLIPDNWPDAKHEDGAGGNGFGAQKRG